MIEYLKAIRLEISNAIQNQPESPVKKRKKSKVKQSDSLISLESRGLALNTRYIEYCSLFKWYDGPLIECMKEGDYFLVDEISLAEDAVLERLNSVLESSRQIVLAEKGGLSTEEITAHKDFRILATMNPGGDFGKKELSPALRNRLTEIWVTQVGDDQDMLDIIDLRLEEGARNYELGNKILSFSTWLSSQLGKSFHLSIRDILSWVQFINNSYAKLGVYISYIHGAMLTVLDGLGIIQGEANSQNLKKSCDLFLISQIPEDANIEQIKLILQSKSDSSTDSDMEVDNEASFKSGVFSIPTGSLQSKSYPHYALDAPTTSINVQRLARALQLSKPILLEGSPGVGKTTLVEALGARSGNKVYRINFSEQTDMMDLLGADLPNDSDLSSEATEPQFSWRNGVLLSAILDID
ncbi:AAA family ATPase [Patescibacteria group bacterium]|nr:AAA family ATPase [Patescibacteria group bacterium]